MLENKNYILLLACKCNKKWTVIIMLSNNSCQVIFRNQLYLSGFIYTQYECQYECQNLPKAIHSYLFESFSTFEDVF